MVNLGCNRYLNVDFVWVLDGKIESTFYDNGNRYKSLRCGEANYHGNWGQGQKDSLLCKPCAIKLGFLW